MSKWKKRAAAKDPLPTESDFDPWNGNLDAQCAWKNFGGLTVDEAFERFRENPLYYHEDFMFMGGKAFAYYFPVVERHLTSLMEGSERDYQAEMLGYAISQQFDGSNFLHTRHLKPRVLALADFVQANLDRFGDYPDKRLRVAEEWGKLVQHIREIT